MRRMTSLCVLILQLAVSGICLVRSTHAQLRTDVLIVGGGTAGTAAAIEAARQGVQVILLEEGPWLGGMLTAAGVSATDGNHALPSGIWGEFRSRLYQVYGGPRGVATGWVSETQFEPHVGDSIFKAMVAEQAGIRVLYRHQLKSALTQGLRITGVVATDLSTGKTLRIEARQTIDATELGDLMAMAGVPYDLGMEADKITQEGLQIPENNEIVQDLTYVAILRDYGPAADCTIVQPEGFRPDEFDCCCSDACSDTSKLYSRVDARKMLAYGRLPNGKYMINWPSHGNDIYLNLAEMNAVTRDRILDQARRKTLRFVYYIQTVLGYKNLGLADDEFPTQTRLPLRAYHREGRRLRGRVRFTVREIASPFSGPMAFYRTGVAVGDYPIDHHHRENPQAPQHLGFYPVPSFNIPLGALIPARHSGLIVAEKAISVSNAANGTTRLQPVVMLTGQAAGALAALCALRRKDASEIPVRDVQAILLSRGAFLMPYFDVPPTEAHFQAVQRIGATGILKGKGEPYKWANRTWFYPDSVVDAKALQTDIKPFTRWEAPGMQLTIQQSINLAGELYRLRRTSASQSAAIASQTRIDADAWSLWGLDHFDPGRPITRAEFAVLLDRTVDPFQWKCPDHKGRYPGE
jgi:hypothetical protein